MTQQGPDGTLLTKATEFADRTSGLLGDCLPEAPPIEVTVAGTKVSLTPRGQAEKSNGVPLRADGVTLAWLRLDFLCRLNSSGEHLAIDRSKVWVVAEVDTTPIFRFDYLSVAGWVPNSHIQVHAERGALSHLLSRTSHKKPHSLSGLHLPTGGARFRPGLEDVIQFLILDCNFDSKPGWQAAVLRERAEWRRIQTRTVTRAWPEEAAAQLVEMGYQVTPPAAGHSSPNAATLEAW